MENDIAHNLRNIRLMLLKHKQILDESYKNFIEIFKKQIHKISDIEKIMVLTGEDMNSNRYKKETLKKTFPDIDFEPMNKIDLLLSNKEELGKIYNKPDEMLQVWSNGLTCYESIIRDFIKKYPFCSDQR